MKLTQDQLKAIEEYKEFLISDEKYMIIQGASGCGKTFILPQLLNITQKYLSMETVLGAKTHKQIYVSATTNAAVSILQTLTNTEAKTIHSLLGLKPQNNYITGKKDLIQEREKMEIWPELAKGILFIDEASMIGKDLFKYIQKILKMKIVFIGDWYQLPPVNESKIIMQELTNKENRTVMLEQVVRNKGLIADNGQQLVQALKTGIFKPIKIDNKTVLHLTGPEFKEAINKEFINNNNTNPNQAKILAYTNDIVKEYIQHIRKQKGLPEYPTAGEDVITNKPIFNMSKKILYHTDSTIHVQECRNTIKLINTPKDCSIRGFNIVLDKKIFFMPYDQKEVKPILKQLAKQKNWGMFYYIKDRWLDLRMPYASTVHKAQGASYKNVYINLTDIGKCYDREVMLKLLYVAITRASEKVFLYGSLPGKYKDIDYV